MKKRHILAIAAAVVLAAAAAVGAWSFHGFAAGMAAVAPEPPPRADLLVALTGGRGRLSAATELLAADRGLRLFISGVNRGVDIDQLAASVHTLASGVRERVSLGYGAHNTRQNAEEIAYHIASRTALGLPAPRSVVVVTSFYHMPRAMLEMRARLPESVELYPFAVFPKEFDLGDWLMSVHNLRLALSEWVKYHITRARIYWFNALE
ncbi:hypothetical protein FACS1894186_3680 [Alphaproteobacteria bacterium]|nr:hypothetical protein FACS1894186_3680 [Alphaproteobacteria bacterium]